MLTFALMLLDISSIRISLRLFDSWISMGSTKLLKSQILVSFHIQSSGERKITAWTPAAYLAEYKFVFTEEETSKLLRKFEGKLLRKAHFKSEIARSHDPKWNEWCRVLRIFNRDRLSLKRHSSRKRQKNCSSTRYCIYAESSMRVLPCPLPYCLLSCFPSC